MSSAAYEDDEEEKEHEFLGNFKLTTT